MTLVEEACYTIRGWPQTSKEVKSASLHTVQKYCLLLFFPIVSTQFAHPVMHIFVLGMCLLEFWFHYNPRMCITWTQCVSLWAAPRCVWAPQDTCWSGKWAVREKTLQIMSSPLSSFFFFFFFFGSKPIDFPFKMVPCMFRLDLPLVGLGSSSSQGGGGSNLLALSQ